jgi:type IV secretory pathway VirB3-like protein
MCFSMTSFGMRQKKGHILYRESFGHTFKSDQAPVSLVMSICSLVIPLHTNNLAGNLLLIALLLKIIRIRVKSEQRIISLYMSIINKSCRNIKFENLGAWTLRKVSRIFSHFIVNFSVCVCGHYTVFMIPERQVTMADSLH